MATVVESEEVKTDEEKAVKKVVEEENEPESAGGCDVCLPPNGLIGCSSYNYKYLCLPSMPWSRGGVAPPQFLGPRHRRGEGALPASLFGRRNRLRVLSHAAHISDES